METAQAFKIALPLETGVRGLKEIEQEASTISTMGDRHHHEGQAEEPIEIETGKAIGRLTMIVEAEVKARQGPVRHTSGGLLVKKSYWKGYR